MSDVKAKAKRDIGGALELVGTFLFGSNRAVKKKARELIDDVDEQVERRRHGRAINGGRLDPEGAIDTEGEAVKDGD